TPFVLYYAAVTATAGITGVGPGLVATLLSVIAGKVLFLGVPILATDPDRRPLIFCIEATLLCLLVANCRRALEAGDAYIRRIFQESPVPMLVADIRFRITRANQAVARLLRIDRSALEGADLGNLLHPPSRERVLTTLGSLFDEHPAAVCGEQVTFA